MTEALPYCIYVLFSKKDAMLYVGYSSNLQNRILNHNAGGTKSTAGKRALKLMLRSTLHTLGYAEKVSFIFANEDEYDG